MSSQTQKIAELITPVLEDMGFDLVRVIMMGGDANPTLQIMAEPLDDDRLMTVEDCEDISHAVSALLDVEDPISGHYTLEVSTPGLDRPLTRLKDFVRFNGFDASVELERPLPSGQKRFKGVIHSVNDNDDLITFETSDGMVEFNFSSVAKAKLILTDELLKSAKQQQEN